MTFFRKFPQSRWVQYDSMQIYLGMDNQIRGQNPEQSKAIRKLYRACIQILSEQFPNTDVVRGDTLPNELVLGRNRWTELGVSTARKWELQVFLREAFLGRIGNKITLPSCMRLFISNCTDPYSINCNYSRFPWKVTRVFSMGKFTGQNPPPNASPYKKIAGLIGGLLRENDGLHNPLIRPTISWEPQSQPLGVGQGEKIQVA